MKDIEDCVINLSDGKKIHGLLRGQIKSDIPLLLIIHGLTSSPYEIQFYDGAKFFYKNGISSLSVFLYDNGEDYRDIKDANLEQNVSDIDEVISFLRDKGVRQIYAIGHSYGGLALLKVKSRLDKLVLWDPSHGLAFKDNDRRSNIVGDYIVSGIGQGYSFPKSFNEINQSMGDTSYLAKNLKCPTRIICAGNGRLLTYCQKYLDNITTKSDIVIIEDAPHNFTKNDKILDQLQNSTLEWFNLD